MVPQVHARKESLTGGFSTSDTDLESYARSSKEKATALVDNNGRPVILLKVNKFPTCSGGIPVFYEDEEIVGNVELNLVKPESVEEIIVSLRGIKKSLTGHPKAFIEVTERLWDASQLEQNTCMNSQSSDNQRVQLKGYFNWPFSLKLPSHITKIESSQLHPSRVQSIGQLPPSFSTSNAYSSISYDVTVSIKGRRNLALSSPFAYVPTTCPPCLAFPIGLHCNEAVREDLWDVFPSFSIRGTAFAAYTCDVLCTLAMPKPLHYTRGTTVLCTLALESSDENVLQLLGSVRAPFVRLCRYVEDSNSGIETKIARLWDTIKHPSAFVSSATWSVADTTSIEERSPEILSALNALKSSMQEDMHSKILIGRIPLPTDLTPSFEFAKMSVKYEIQMLPFKAAGFVPEDGNKAIFFRASIRIASVLPMPASTRPSSAAASRSSSMHRQHATPTPSSSSSLPLRPHPEAAAAASFFPVCVFDRPLPSLPRIEQDGSGSIDGGRLHRLAPERISMESRSQRESERESEYEREHGDCTGLRRAATAPRVPPRTSRSPFPSRQCTR